MKISLRELRELIRESIKLLEAGEASGGTGAATTDLSNPKVVKDIADAISAVVAKGATVKTPKNIKPGKTTSSFEIPTGAGNEVLKVTLTKK